MFLTFCAFARLIIDAKIGQVKFTNSHTVLSVTDCGSDSSSENIAE